MIVCHLVCRTLEVVLQDKLCHPSSLSNLLLNVQEHDDEDDDDEDEDGECSDAEPADMHLNAGMLTL